MPAPQIIEQLVERFERNLPSYKSGIYNETQVRLEFINPFFEALGWDVQNKKGYAEAYKDVVHEYSQKTADSVEAPDYCFRIGGTRKFFVEAKKPSVNVKHDVHPAFQVRRYAWSAKLPLSILTDFEEFAVYDCRIPPKKNDKPSTARIIYFHYKDYLQKWDEIESIFSRDSILKGSFDKYAETNKKKKGTAEVDDTFLKTIEAWREYLAKNIALRNPGLTTRELNYSVQKTIDRIIFLRICEDRGIEEYGQLLALQNGANVYQRMVQIFTRADEKYNSGLFHFELEKNRYESPDELTPKLSIDDKILKEIIKNLYYPESPFEFSVLPADILGQVYEQFLGKVIRLTEGHQAKIENKPEVKKAGGVYYTPTYIVDYIVQNTLGKILTSHSSSPLSAGQADLAKGRTKEGFPKSISKIKILDPACGSGSFLIAAYQYLLDWHLKYYTSDEENLQKNLASKNPKIYQAANGEFRLTTAERKRILLNNIYGVDIDPQAVEVTKLSLLLKVLEGENEETLNSQLKMFHERALPDLANNIKCGNSLIGPDFYNQMEMNFLNDEEKLRINVFDWNSEFKEIMDNGGFDIVIGNPPWGADFSQQELAYLRENNSDIIIRMIDSFMYFVYQTSKKLNDNGNWGMILPDVILYQKDNEKLREYILDNFGLSAVLNVGNVFKNVIRPSAILILTSKETPETLVADLSSIKDTLKHFEIEKDNNYQKIKTKVFSEIPNKMFVTKNITDYKILDRIIKNFKFTLGDFVDGDGIQRGVSPDYKDAFIVKTNIIKEFNLEKEKLKHVVTGGRQIKRYFIEDHDLWLIYNDRNVEIKNFPNIKNYILSFKEKITCKEVKAGKHSLFSLHRARDERIFLKEKKFLGVITEDEIIVALDRVEYYATDGIYLFGLKEEVNDYYILSILNSKLLVFIYRLLALESGRVLAQVKPTLLSSIPIPNYEKNNSENLILKAEVLESLIKKFKEAKTPQEKTALQRQIKSTDKQIDQLVYKLYGLTEEEIKIVEKTDGKY